MTAIAQNKQQLRIQMRRVLSDCSAFAPLSLAACRNAANLPAFEKARTLLCYIALDGEADPLELVRIARAKGKRVAFPYFTAGNYDMQARLPFLENELVQGSYGVMMPDEARSTLIEPQELDLVVVPGLAFAPNGARLGRGAGYYDRYLARTNAFRMGFCVGIQMVKDIPADAFDIRMDAVITEENVFDFKI